jgi:hypothetical protein
MRIARPTHGYEPTREAAMAAFAKKLEFGDAADDRDHQPADRWCGVSPVNCS